MRIFKFGGASVKDANAVKNVATVLQKEGTENLIVVISAMGKTTNALEEVVSAYHYKTNNLIEKINSVVNYHITICNELFTESHKIHQEIKVIFEKLNFFINSNASSNYNLIYDQIVSYGELLSTTIVSNYLNKEGLTNNWVDIRKFIRTDNTYRDAQINWETSQEKIKTLLNHKNLIITQGFLGGCENNTTTLGREGSDYTAGILAYCTNAKSVTIWKDVDGVLNADPRVFNTTQLLKRVSYKEAIEMAFYGASVIHPKTIQPLEQKNIPLYVKSFTNLNTKGTCVGKGEGIEPETPCFIVKKNQILISIASKDFSFIVEDNISTIFKKLHEYHLKVNLIQNSAISFSVCVDDKFNNYNVFLENINKNFNITTYKNVTLFTIRHFNNAALETIKEKGTTIIQQINTTTAQLVIQEN